MGDLRGASLKSILKAKLLTQSGMSLMELSFAIVILGLCALPLMDMYSMVAIESVHSEFQNTATVVGRALMEEIIAKDFDENSSSTPFPPSGDPITVWPTNWSNALGTNAGESTNADFDDVDDYDGYSETAIAGYPGFTRSATVYYVYADDDPLNTDFDTVRLDTARTNYKRIDVTVTHAKVGTMTFSEVVSSSHSGN
ncbi:MAG: prepilin-type N-terminal cleavage/methylation domain-containing protein [Candidatus Omnitrophica bacterium]|nr:prepilin-type N-terminal cleavage/methylation domain-containing protein [Candidatus Omnitrophota bacterium]